MRLRPLASAAILLGAAASVLAAPAAAQEGEPAWIHLSALAGGIVASEPGEAPRPAATLQLEISRTVPIGVGLAAGFAWPSAARAAAEPVGPWAEATFAYRFRLRFRGYLAPYAGPVLGIALHDTDVPGAPAAAGSRVERWHFGGRAGMDIPVGSGWPAVRVEIAYRHSPSAGGLPGYDLATAFVGFRWSRALTRARGD